MATTTSTVKNRPLTRDQLAKFLPDHEAIKAFENLQLSATASDEVINALTDRVEALENPGVIEVSTNYTTSTEFPAVVVNADGVVVTLRPCVEVIKGKTWSITLAVEGALTIRTSPGNSIATPGNPAETEVILNRRGSTVDFRCITGSTWSFV
jgi:hypothetical protein